MKRIAGVSCVLPVLFMLLALPGCERRADVPPGQPMEGEAQPAPPPPEQGVAPGAGEAVLPAAPGGGVVVEMIDGSGAVIGGARVEAEGDGVRISIRVTGLTPGEHGLHIHETGRCDPPSFETAGGHFAPGGRQHGFENPQGPHAGDMPNLRANERGVADTSFLVTTVRMGTGTNGLQRAGGTALVVHERADDYRTDPSGDSGSRIACGVIRG
jgi:superoxide dismutase, Cu-Zn family